MAPRFARLRLGLRYGGLLIVLLALFWIGSMIVGLPFLGAYAVADWLNRRGVPVPVLLLGPLVAIGVLGWIEKQAKAKGADPVRPTPPRRRWRAPF